MFHGHTRRAFNLGNSSYPGMSCPYLRRESDPDEQYYLLNWYLDPEYTLYEGCQCAKVRASNGSLKASEWNAATYAPSISGQGA